MQADLSSKVFEMAHSLHLVMGLVGHTKQIFASHLDSFPLCFFFPTMPLQTQTQIDSNETFEWLILLTFDPCMTAKTFDTESIH